MITLALKINKSRWLGVFLITLFSFGSYGQNQEKSTARNLDKVQLDISDQKTKISDHKKKILHFQNQLKQDDIAIATVIKSLNIIQKKLTKNTTELDRLAKEKRQLHSKKKSQETLLAAQLKTMHATGQYDYLKLLLNQDKPADVQRTLTYYHYVNNARIKEIDQFNDTLANIAKVTFKEQTVKSELQALQIKQTADKLTLEQEKTKRTKTVTALNKVLSSDQQKLESLEAQEKNLVAALRELANQQKKVSNLKGLSSLKRKLFWPVKGKLSHKFGSQKQGYLKWKGVLLTAPVGRKISTIHHGTVLFADWLKGYGLVTVIDHGDGYMSLYGHNQTLLKSVGDRVETGETIALVGQSGGQSRAGLYFEIRHQGKAVNPKLWCR